MVRARFLGPVAVAGATLAGLLGTGQPAVAGQPFVGPFHQVSRVASTVPGNGDVNPYGVAVVPVTMNRLHRGDVLVSNFNDRHNLQGTGITIVQVAPDGQRSTFARIDGDDLPGPCPGGVGLTTALVVLRAGWVVVGSLPTSNGTASTARAGCLIVLDSDGLARETWHGDGIDGPWDATAADYGNSAQLFVSNVLNGTEAAGGAVTDRGTVLRLGVDLSGRLPRLVATTVVASGLAERTDPAALVVGPTGLGLGADGTLYVAETVHSLIRAVGDALHRSCPAGPGRVVSSGGELTGPLGLVVAPGGDLLTVNGGNGDLVEVSPSGAQVAIRRLDSSGHPPGAGALFGLAVAPGGHGVYFVDDATNQLDLLH